MKKKKEYFWYVDTGLYHRQLKVKASGMPEAQQKAYEKFKKMDFEEFKKFIDLNVGGWRRGDGL